jgi:hypothetical protein
MKGVDISLVSLMLLADREHFNIVGEVSYMALSTNFIMVVLTFGTGGSSLLLIDVIWPPLQRTAEAR